MTSENLDGQLRPIGSLFWFEYPYSPRTGYQIRFLYRVESYQRFGLTMNPHETGYLGEHIVAIRAQKRWPTNLTYRSIDHSCQSCGATFEWVPNYTGSQWEDV